MLVCSCISSALLSCSWQELLSPDCPSLLAHPEGVHSCQLPQLVSLALLVQLEASSQAVKACLRSAKYLQSNVATVMICTRLCNVLR